MWVTVARLPEGATPPSHCGSGDINDPRQAHIANDERFRELTRRLCLGSAATLVLRVTFLRGTGASMWSCDKHLNEVVALMSGDGRYKVKHVGYGALR